MKYLKYVIIIPVISVAIAVGITKLQPPKKTVAVRPSTNGLPASVHKTQVAGLSNVFQLNKRVYSGSSPATEEGFKALKDLGVTTIISVEGAKPDVEAAKKFGLRYVHLPLGYTGLPTNNANMMVKAAAISTGSVYVHCQYGWQRGPAGAAIVCMGMDGWTPEQATAWLTLADTTSNYTGLFYAVGKYQPPTREFVGKMSSDLPETTQVTALTEEMVEMSERYKTLRSFRAVGFQKLPNHELSAQDEARVFYEHLKRMQSSALVKKYDADFNAKLGETVAAAKLLYDNLLVVPLEPVTLDANLRSLNQSCVNCHRDFRK